MKRQLAASPAQPPAKERFAREQLPLSELPLFLNKTYTLNVPVYTVWGACEDVQVLEKLRSGEYKVQNLHIIDEAHSRLLEVGGVKLRLLGLGGAVVMHKLFDNGEGRTTIAGGQGTMWTTLLQMGELVDTANRVYDPTETRVFVTHASPAREGLLNQLSVTLKADFSISAGLHFRYGSSYNEFSVNPTLDHYRGKLAASKASFNDVWETVKAEVEPAVAESESQQKLLNYAIDIVNKMPTVANGGNPFGGQGQSPASGQVDESAFKNMWNFNLADAAFGWLVLDIDNGRIGTEMRAQGFNFAHRGGKVTSQQSPAHSVPPSANTVTAAGGNVLSQSAQPPPTQRPGQPATAPLSQQNPTPRAPSQPNMPASNPSPGQQQNVQQGMQQQRNTVGQNYRAAPSPPTKEMAKPANTQPSTGAAVANAQSTGSSDKAIPSEVKPNGVGGPERPSESAAQKTDPAPVEKKPMQTLFITNVKDEEEARQLFPEDCWSKFEKVEKIRHFCLVHFASPEEMQAVLARVPAEHKAGRFEKPYVRVYRDFSDRQQRTDSAGRWQGNSRPGPQTGGYRSGGASDSEGGRGGRGTFRGRGGRGGERGRGRGGRGGSAAKGAQGDGNGAMPAASTTPSGGDA